MTDDVAPAGRPRMLGWLLPALAAATLILAATAWRWAGVGLGELPMERRYWEDVAVAASHLPTRVDRAEPEEIGSGEGHDVRRALSRYLVRRASEDGIGTWSFWRTVPMRPFFARAVFHARGNDDPGRGMLLRAAFALLGGIAPALPLWLGAFASIPVLLWSACELRRAAGPVAAAAFVLLAALWPYTADMLSLPYSAVGFYLLGLIALVPLAAYVALGAVTARGLLVRCAAAGVVLAVCILCRGGTLLQLPGYLLALAIGAARLAAPWRVRAGVAALGCALLVGPFLAVRPAQHHEVWLGVWEGLGDFDRTHGHAWSDAVVRDLLASEGVVLPRDAPVWYEAEKQEPIFRRRVLESIRSDPAWYVGILARRTAATIVQWKLWPWAPRDGISMRPATAPEEGATDSYYEMTTTADWFGVGPFRFELPMTLLLAPPIVLGVLWATRRSRAVPARAALVLLCVAAAALAVPVAITTASGPETQAFVVVYWIAAALALEELASRWRRATVNRAGWPSRRAPGSPGGRLPGSARAARGGRRLPRTGAGASSRCGAAGSCSGA